MTTYPLSEPATIHTGGASDVLGKGTLADCADQIESLSPEARKSARIVMDDIDLEFGPEEINALLKFLREEGAGLSDQEISAIPEGAS
jgi:hypothetical protein